jgi:hypothetical protein
MEDNTIIKSGFNEASLAMQRIDVCKSRINDLWLSPFDYHIVFLNKRNYEVITSELLNLINFVWGKCNPTEQGQIERYKDLIFDFMETKPIFQVKTLSMIDGVRRHQRPNYDNWKAYRTLLFKFQLFMETLYEVHNLNAPNKAASNGGWD